MCNLKVLSWGLHSSLALCCLLVVVQLIWLIGRSHWTTCSFCPYLDTLDDLKGWYNLPEDAMGRKKLSPILSVLSLCVSHTHTQILWGLPGRRAGMVWENTRNTCNRLVLLMLGNKSSHPSPASPSSPSLALIGWGSSTLNTETLMHQMDVFILFFSLPIAMHAGNWTAHHLHNSYHILQWRVFPSV